MITTVPALNPETLLETLSWRYATKKFNPSKKIDGATWQALAESLALTPSSYGLQPWKFLVVEDPELRAKLREHSWGQGQVTDASHFVVFTARTDVTEADVDRYLARIAEVRGVSLESLAGFRKMLVDNLVNRGQRADIPEWAARQTYIALGQLMTAAAALGVDATPMEGLDPKAYDRILGLEGSGYATTMACALGYRAEDDGYAKLPKVRFATEELVVNL
ncbi:MAG TPA: NAD(P)H-dependent oxidoreductase [Holophagaceae bacterium]|nr:NAD(P)H-dependent oxidoreductase [Holophagaceae bacterium]